MGSTAPRPTAAPGDAVAAVHADAQASEACCGDTISTTARLEALRAFAMVDSPAGEVVVVLGRHCRSGALRRLGRGVRFARNFATGARDSADGSIMAYANSCYPGLVPGARTHLGAPHPRFPGACTPSGRARQRATRTGPPPPALAPRSLPAGAKQSQLVRRVRSWLWWRRDFVASAVLGCARGSGAHGPPP